MNVVINASGGGSDLGKSGNGVIESTKALEISKALESELKKSGINTYMLREDDTTLPYKDRINILKGKFPDKKNTLVISNTLNDNNGIDIIYQLNKSDK